jgi:hypothetical protein
MFLVGHSVSISAILSQSGMFLTFLAVLADIPPGELSEDGSFLDVYIFSTDPNGRPIERPFGSVRFVDRQASYLRD